MQIRISTDSTADIPVPIREELDISVLPLNITTSDREYLDGYDITPEEFYKVLESAEQMPTSSQVTPYRYSDLYEETWKAGYTDLIQTTLNGKGSSTWQSAVQMREMFYEEHPEAKDSFRIHIVDSGTYSMGYGWAVIEAARMAKAGAGVEEIIEFITDWVQHVRVIFAPMNLKWVKKSGRISAAAAFIGEAVGLKPIILFEDGEAKIVTKARGAKKAIAALADMCREEHKEGTPYMLAGGSDPAAAEQLLAACRDKLGQEPAVQYQLGCIITINAGPDAVGLVYRR